MNRPCATPPHKEEPAVARLVRALDRLRPRLKRILWHFRLRPEEAEDVLQEVVTVALDHLQRTPIDDLEAWLVVTLRNQCVMFYRKEAARLRREAVWAERLAARWKADRNPDLAEALRVCLATLPGRDRRILQLRMAGCSYLEVVAQTGYSFDVVRKANLATLRRLRRLLGSAERRQGRSP